MSSKKIPSLENLINQCCEHYYSRLNEHVEDELEITPAKSNDQQQQQPNQYYSYDKFQDFINASHCQENLKFLIEIFHYEKIWNKTFKRQSSILKCKEEEPIMFSNSRKQSVATIRTMNSRRSNRHPSIVEEGSVSPPFSFQPATQIQVGGGNEANIANELNKNDLDKLVQELSLPKILNNIDDFDSKSFVNQDVEKPKSSYSNSNSNSNPHSISPSPSPSPPNGLINKRTSLASHSSSKRNAEVWDTLFKPSYICEKNNECQCHPNNFSDPNLEGSNDQDITDALEQQELLEQNKLELQEKFEYIIQDYVINNSPYQINLPDTVYSNLLKEYENNKILYHSPLTLLPAKNAVLQLLRENIYYNFLTDQENLINKDNSKKIITKMDELKLSNSNSAGSSTSSQPKSSTSNPASVSIDGKPEKLKTHGSTNSNKSNLSNISTKSVQEPSNTKLRNSKSEKNLFKSSEAPTRSFTVDDSLKPKSNNQGSTISNFLNKYHIKIHSNTTTSGNSSSRSSLASYSHHNSETSSINSSASPISPIQLPTTTKTIEINTNFTPRPSTSNSITTSSSSHSTPLKKSFDRKTRSHTNNHGHGHGSVKYVKGPCGIEPEISDYDPKPPKHSWSRLFNKKRS